jgi:hypothetical protein
MAGERGAGPLLMGFIDNGPQGLAGDPVVAAGRGGLVVFGHAGVQAR